MQIFVTYLSPIVISNFKNILFEASLSIFIVLYSFTPCPVKFLYNSFPNFFPTFFIILPSLLVKTSFIELLSLEVETFFLLNLSKTRFL